MPSEDRQSPNTSNKTLSVERQAALCGVGAVTSGLIYLSLAEAPIIYGVINAATFLVAVLIVVALRRSSVSAARYRAQVMTLCIVLLWATTLFGAQVDGASRWLRAGPLLVQPAAVLLPWMLTAFSDEQDWPATASIVAAALALAFQPDRAMAGTLFFALLALVSLARNARAACALSAALVAFVITLLRPDNLPAVAHVEQIVFTSFDVGVPAAMAVILGLLLLPMPGLLAASTEHIPRERCFVFSATWFALALASVLGNYPTPVVGYSGAMVAGYVLSVGGLLGVSTAANPKRGVA